MPTKKKKRKLTYVADSTIHGTGLFAARNIPKDTLVAVGKAHLVTEDATHVLWLTDEDGNTTGHEITNFVRYINHARKANADFYELEVWSLRKIEKGEEITINYGSDWDDLD